MSVKNITACNNLPLTEVKTVAKKYGIATSGVTKRELCTAIKRRYTIGNPCTLKILKDTDLTIKKHQLNVANFLANDKNRGVVVTHSVGTGKTLTAISSAECLLLSRIITSVIVVTPTSLQNNFKEQMEMYGVTDTLRDKYEFYTIGELVNAIENGNPPRVTNALLIIDEAHNLRTLDGKTFDSIFLLAKKAKKIMLLTATPLINYDYDIINLVSMVTGEPPISRDEFYHILSYKKLATEYLQNIFSFYTKPPDDSNFPAKKIHEIFIPMNHEYEELYNKVEKGHVSRFKDFKGKDITVFYNGVRRASNIIDELSPKTTWIINKMKSEPKGKFVIFSHFLNMGMRPLMEYLDRKKIPYKSITGDTSKQERQNAVNAYNTKAVRILFISKAGSEGLDLKNTNNIIIMESSWNLNSIEQIIGRGVRYKSHEGMPKSKRLVNVYKLMTVKPDEYKNISKILAKNLLLFNGRMLSVDLYLRNYAWLKQQEIIAFYDYLRKFNVN
jgi:SNF2 family DNA or RNA helicase